MLLIALLACGEKEEDTGTTVEEVVDRTGLVVTVEPSTIDFGMVDLGGSSERAVTVKNKGDTLVLLTQMEVANIDLTIDAGGAFAVEPGQTLDLNVIWSPTIAGVIDDTLTVSAGETPDATETWLTTISGLVPMAMGNASMMGMPYSSMGQAMIGGLMVSTFMTLFVVPLFYTLFDDLRTTTVRLLSLGIARSQKTSPVLEADADGSSSVS